MRSFSGHRPDEVFLQLCLMMLSHAADVLMRHMRRKCATATPAIDLSGSRRGGSRGVALLLTHDACDDLAEVSYPVRFSYDGGKTESFVIRHDRIG